MVVGMQPVLLEEIQMTKVRRGGRELTVKDTDVSMFLEQGYDVIDDRGNVIEHAGPMDYKTSMKRIAELEARNADLVERLNEATADLAKVRKELKALQKKNSKEE